MQSTKFFSRTLDISELDLHSGYLMVDPVYPALSFTFLILFVIPEKKKS